MAVMFQIFLERLCHNVYPIHMGSKINFILKTSVLKYVLEEKKKNLNWTAISFPR